MRHLFLSLCFLLLSSVIGFSQEDESAGEPDISPTADPASAEVALPPAVNDPSFDRYVDFVLLAQAVNKQDPAGLTDAGLQLAEGERILGRTPNAKGITAERVLLMANELASETNHEETLARLQKASESLGNKALSDAIAAKDKLGGESRTILAGSSVPLSMPAEEFHLLKHYIDSIRRAQILRDLNSLKELLELLKDEKSLPQEQLKRLTAVATEAQAVVEKNPASNDDALLALTDASRGPAWLPKNSQFPPRINDPILRACPHCNGTGGISYQGILRGGSRADEIRDEGVEQPTRETRLLEGESRVWGIRYPDPIAPPIHDHMLRPCPHCNGTGRISYQGILRGGSRADEIVEKGVEQPTNETSLLEGESRGWGIKDLDPTNKNSGIRQAGRDFDRERLKMMSNSPQPGRDYTKVYVRNDTREHVWVAVRYEPFEWSSGESTLAEYVPDTDGPFDTHAWYKLAPGERSHLANTANIHFYVYAETQGRSRTWSGSHRKPFGNRTIEFSEKLIVAPQYEEYTININ